METERNRSDLGFTLIELMVVVLIVGILLGVAIPTFIRARSNAVLASCKADTRTVTQAVAMYNLDTAGTPVVTADLLTSGPVPYLQAIPSKIPSYAITIVGGVVMVAAPSTATPVAADSASVCGNAGQVAASATNTTTAVTTGGPSTVAAAGTTTVAPGGTTTTVAAAATTTTTIAPAGTTTTVAQSTTTSTTAPNSGLTATASVSPSTNPWYGENQLSLVNTKPLTALSITMTIVRTPGVTYNGQYSTFWGGTVSASYVDAVGTIRYTFTLNAGNTMVTGNWVAAAQFSGTGTPRVTSGDTWTVTSTSSSGTSTLSGTF